MGQRGIEIIKGDVNEIIEMLNKAYADEWLAYYQYWIGAKIVKGPMKDAVMAELIQHSLDELRHAGLIADRIIQIGGIPLVSPPEWITHCNCSYQAPIDPEVIEILKQNISGERCAITAYSKLLDKTRVDDPVTYNMVLQILQDEVMHEEDLQNLSEDIDILIKKYR
jgi:bacterioferritin